MASEEHLDSVLSRSMSRRTALQIGVAGLGGMLGAGSLIGCGDGGDSGSATSGAKTSAAKAPTGQLAPFDPSAPAGTPSNLPKRIAFANPFDAALNLEFSDAMKSAAESRGLEYLAAISNGDPARMAQQVEGFLARGIGVLFMSPVEVEATLPQVQRALDAGVGVFGVQRPFTHLQITEDQTAIGIQQARAAVKWIKENLGGEAEVAYFNEDNAASLVPRHKAALAEFKKGGPGIKIVSDVQAPLETQAGANAMNTILQAHPNVKVVLGGNGAIGGAFVAYDAKGMGNAKDVYLSSIAGADDALELIRSGNSAYKATFVSSLVLSAYAAGQFAADWMEGKSIPQGITSPNGLVEISSPEAVDEWKADMDDIPTTWETKRDKYCKFYGNVRYEDRENYLKEVWVAS